MKFLCEPTDGCKELLVRAELGCFTKSLNVHLAQAVKGIPYEASIGADTFDHVRSNRLIVRPIVPPALQ